MEPLCVPQSRENMFIRESYITVEVCSERQESEGKNERGQRKAKGRESGRSNGKSWTREKRKSNKSGSLKMSRQCCTCMLACTDDICNLVFCSRETVACPVLFSVCSVELFSSALSINTPVSPLLFIFHPPSPVPPLPR